MLWREGNISQGKHSNLGMGNRRWWVQALLPKLSLQPSPVTCTQGCDSGTEGIHVFCIDGTVLTPWEPPRHPRGAASLTIFVIGDSYGCHVHLPNPSSAPVISKGAAQIDLELLFWFEGRVVNDVNTAVLHLKPREEEKAANTDKSDKAT